MPRNLALTLLLALVSFGALADWTVGEHTDSMTDTITKSAFTRNAQGYRLGLFRVDSGEVWMAFSLPEGTTEILSDRAPMFRVDKLAAEGLGVSKELEELLAKTRKGRKMQITNAKTFAAVIWHGKGDANGGSLRNIMQGQEILFRYYTIGGDWQETRFALSGAKEAIAKAVDIPADADPETAAKERAFLQVSSAALDTCKRSRISQERIVCMKKISECRKSAAGEASAMQKCLEK